MENVKIEELYKQFSEKIIFENANATFESGKISFLMSPNGWGKTTLIKLLSGLQKEDSGKVQNPYIHQDSFTLYDDLSLYGNLSGYKNIEIFTKFKYSKEEIDAVAIRYLPSSRLKKKISIYSLGEGKKISLIIWELLTPKLSMMDEITNGLDYQALADLKKLLIEAKTDKIILLTGHDFGFYEDIIDNLYVLSDYKIIQEMKWKEYGVKGTYEKYFAPRN
ncbi:ATP-binding cassette domain-containing protein [Lactococcus ileimucosae]|uniref:ATP-binding cassette domain-containing protein n=1 Tax=Lactococcus ileimucosae TaxID=2941329 RepID=UPI0035189F9C